MWLLLVTTVVSAVLVDAGYLYNAPNVPFNLPAIKVTNIHPGHVPQPHDFKVTKAVQEEDKSITYSISYKDYVYLKDDSVGNNNLAHGNQQNTNYNNLQSHGHIGHAGSSGSPATQNLHNHIGSHSNNGYASYNNQQPLTPVINNYNAQSYALPQHSHGNHAAPLTRVVTNNGYAHTSQGINNANTEYSQVNNLPSSTSYIKSHTHTASHNSPTLNNVGFTQTITAPGNNNYNSGYSQISAPIVPTANTNNYAQSSSVQTTGHNLNHGYGHTTGPDAYNSYAPPLNPVTQTSSTLTSTNNHVPQINGNLNNAYSPVAQSGSFLNNAYSQFTTNQQNTGITQNSGNPNNLSPFGFNSGNGYAQTASASASSNLNNGFAPTSVSSASINLNNGYSQTAAPTGGSNLYTGYDYSSSANTDSSVFRPSPQITEGSSSNNGYSHTSTGPTHIDLNSIIPQAPASPITAVGNSFTQTLTTASGNLNSGLAQSNINTAVNSASVSPSNPQVTPVIHKHIYFHVPPPEIEEPPKAAPPPPPPKKNYKILFIKVPSQESRSNLALLKQQIAERQNAAVEDKTLIYVLVKNPEDPKPVVLPKPKPSEHQVYFVKYNGSPFDIASQVNQEIDNTGAVKSIVPLEPGLVNGQHK